MEAVYIETSGKIIVGAISHGYPLIGKNRAGTGARPYAEIDPAMSLRVHSGKSGRRSNLYPRSIKFPIIP